MHARPSIDLNADLGEGCGNDAALYALISSANIAAGGHAGGGDLLDVAVRAAAKHRVSAGAHPGYPDRENFGRVSLLATTTAGTLFTPLVEQILTVAEAAQTANINLTHVKAHGALYHDAHTRHDAANLLVHAVLKASDQISLPGMPLPIVGMPGTLLERYAHDYRIPFIREGFADRAYAPDGTLVPRSEPGAVLHDKDAVVAQARQLATTGTVTAVDGTVIDMPVDTLCVHGDTPEAVEFASSIRADLESLGYLVGTRTA